MTKQTSTPATTAEHRFTITITPMSEADLQLVVDDIRKRFGRKHLIHVIGKQPSGTNLADAPEWAEIERMRRNLDDREQAGQAAIQAAARIDAAFSHGVPSGSEDPVTADDWDRLIRYARTGGTERPV